MLAEDEAALAHELERARRRSPSCAREALAPGEPARLEPCVAPGLAGIRLEAGYAVPPAAATAAFAARADAAGARLAIGEDAVLAPGGIAVGGRAVAAGAVVVAAGPWTPAVVDPSGAWRPIAALWGVNVEVHLRRAAAPRGRAGRDRRADRDGRRPAAAVQHGHRGRRCRRSARRSSPPSPTRSAFAPRLRANGARFVPALATTPIASVRACARPLSADGRPLLGRAPGRDDVFVAAGHGAWGISLGPGSARLVADLVLGRGDVPPAAFDPARFPA